MTSAGDPNPRARRGWTLLVALAALIAALVGVDAWLKRGSLPGVVLPNAEITLTATDLPSAWAALETSNTFGRIQTDAPDLRQRTGVWLRQQTGVRWTPLRWYVWFGRPLDVSIQGGDWMIACRPGLLLRAADAFNALGPAAWREGWLLIGSSQDAVQRLANEGVKSQPIGPSDAITIRWRGKSPGEMTVRFDGEWEMSGAIELDGETSARADAESRRIDTWPGTPIATLFVTRESLLDSLLPSDWPEFPMHAEIESAWDRFRERLPRDWDGHADIMQFALESVDVSGTLPVPAFGVIVRSVPPFPPLALPVDAVPFTWGITEGWMSPWLGEPASLYAAGSTRMRVFANQEPTMARLLDSPLPGRIASDDVRLTIDFRQLGAAAKSIVRTAAEEELLPGYSKSDVDIDIVPLLSALTALDQLEMRGYIVESRLEFEGGLFALPEAADSE